MGFKNINVFWLVLCLLLCTCGGGGGGESAAPAPAPVVGCTGASPTWTTSPDYASVNTCVNNASAEDTINVAVGSGAATWSSTLTITKGIRLIGPGAASLIITSGVTPTINYKPSAVTGVNNYALRISGFTFNTNDYGGIGLCGSTKGVGNCTSSNNMGAVAQTNIRIDHNAFIGTHGYVAIEVVGAFRGVVDNNTFNGYSVPHRAWGTGVGDTDWSTFGPYSFGTADNMYFEDNTYTNVGGYMISDCDQGGRYAFRYNSISLSGDMTPLFDYHEGSTNGSDHWGCFGGEIYGNQVTRNGYNTFLLGQRSAKVLGFYNDAAAGSGIISVYRDSEGGVYCPPAPNLTDQLINNSYYWNNRKGVAGVIIIATKGTDACGDANPAYAITENASFWTELASFDGTVGVGCGTLVARPGTCTTGVAYWATNQSCTNLTGMVGANPATKIVGKLYKCTALNIWSSDDDGITYEPYAYPHPLRN